MTRFLYLLGFVAFCVWVDACRSSTQKSEDIVLGSIHTVDKQLVITSLCDSSQRAFELPNGSLPRPGSIPGAKRGQNNDSIFINYLQDYANHISWKNFIALNWLATDIGTPDSTSCFGTRDGITVWEHWMPGHEIFKSATELPKAWEHGMTANGHPKNSVDEPVFKSTKLNDLTRFDADRELVPNQYGLNTLFEVYYNKPIYNYIVAGKLYNLAGQREFVQQWPRLSSGLVLVKGNDTVAIEKEKRRVYMPISGSKDTTIQLGDNKFIYTKNRGAMMIKSAWMILTPKEDASTYHVRRVKFKGRSVMLGLIALHLAYKVAEAPQWVWSTFEHTRNAPVLDEQGQAILKPGVDYLYFDETKSDTSLYNKALNHPKSGRFKTKGQVQIVRLRKGEAKTEKANDHYHDLIKKANPKSVWLHYRLVGTQWPFINPDPFRVAGRPVPALMANAMMETYHQQTSSCMGCHTNARILATADSSGYFADFIWGLALHTPKSKKK